MAVAQFILVAQALGNDVGDSSTQSITCTTTGNHVNIQPTGKSTPLDMCQEVCRCACVGVSLLCIQLLVGISSLMLQVLSQGSVACNIPL